MLEIESVIPAARRWVDVIETDRWALFAMNPRIKCEHVTNNMIESLNHVIKEPREGTYLAPMEKLRKLMMTKMDERGNACEKWEGQVSLVVRKKMMKMSCDGTDFLMRRVWEGFL